MGLSRNSYYRGFDWMMQGGVLLLIIMAPLEGRGKALYQAGQVFVLAGMAGRCGMDFCWPYLRRVLVTYVVAVAILLLACLAWSRTREDPKLFSAAAQEFLKQYSFLLLATAFLACYKESAVLQRIRRHPKILAIVLAMIAFWFLTVVASMVSLDTDESLRTVRKEIGPYILLFLVVIESTRTWVRLRRLLMVTFIVGSLTCLASCIGYLLYSYANHYDVTWLQLWMGSDKGGFIVRTNPGRADVLVQAQFPFSHPNRLGSYGVIVTMLSLVALPLVSSWRLRAWIALGGAAAYAAVVLSGTRGAMLAAVGGLVVMAILWDWRSLIALAVGLPLAFIVMPDIQKSRVKSILDPREWNLVTGDSNIARRVYIWFAAAEMIRAYPWFGIGYGDQVFEDNYPAFRDRAVARYGIRAVLSDPEDKTHAHNNFLQVGASSGLPAMAAFTAFSILLALGFLRRWQRPLPDFERFRYWAGAMFALWMAMLAFGLTNFSLRGGIGMYIWLLLGASVAFIQLSADPPIPQQRPVK